MLTVVRFLPSVTRETGSTGEMDEAFVQKSPRKMHQTKTENLPQLSNGFSK